MSKKIAHPDPFLLKQISVLSRSVDSSSLDVISISSSVEGPLILGGTGYAVVVTDDEGRPRAIDADGCVSLQPGDRVTIEKLTDDK
jgi:hypothetical protein